jgi:NADH-quinone oxidoreductase subunit E
MGILNNPKYEDRIQWNLNKYPDRRSAVMPLLYLVQEEYGWITDEGIREVADIINVDSTQVKSIAGFYTMYSEKPKGKYWLQVCNDLACALRGSDEFHHDLLHYLDIEEGGTTTDGLFTVEHVMCLAACDKAPMLQCNFHYMEDLDMAKIKAWVEEKRAELERESSK